MVSLILFLQCFVPLLSTLTYHVTKSNGDLDPVAVTNYFLRLEQTMTDIQSQCRTEEQKQAAVLSSVLSKLSSTSEELSKVQEDLRSLDEKHKSSLLEVSALKSKINVMEAEMEMLKAENNSFHMDLAGNYNQLSLNTTETDILKSKYQNYPHATEPIDYQKGCTDMTKSIDEYVGETLRKSEQLEKELNSTKMDVSRVNTQIKSIIPTQTNLSTQMNQMETRVKLMDQTVFFKADLHYATSYPTNTTIVFDRVESNLGNAYNPSTGVFTAPLSGYYTFTATIQKLDDGLSSYAIMNQGKREIQLVLTKALDPGSATTVFHVNKGDGVYVFTMYEDGSNIRLVGSFVTHFRGYLLHAD